MNWTWWSVTYWLLYCCFLELCLRLLHHQLYFATTTARKVSWPCSAMRCWAFFRPLVCSLRGSRIIKVLPGCWPEVTACALPVCISSKAKCVDLMIVWANEENDWSVITSSWVCTQAQYRFEFPDSSIFAALSEIGYSVALLKERAEEVNGESGD